MIDEQKEYEDYIAKLSLQPLSTISYAEDNPFMSLVEPTNFLLLSYKREVLEETTNEKIVKELIKISPELREIYRANIDKFSDVIKKHFWEVVVPVLAGTTLGITQSKKELPEIFEGDIDFNTSSITRYIDEVLSTSALNLLCKEIGIPEEQKSMIIKARLEARYEKTKKIKTG